MAKPSPLSAYVEVSARRCLHRDRWWESEARGVVVAWIAAALRDGLGRMPPGVIVDVVISSVGLHSRRSGWDTSWGRWLGQLGPGPGRVWDHPERLTGDQVVAVLRSALAMAMAAGFRPPDPPTRIDGSKLLAAVRDMAGPRHGEDPEWSFYVEEWMAGLAMAGPAALRRQRVPLSLEAGLDLERPSRLAAVSAGAPAIAVMWLDPTAAAAGGMARWRETYRAGKRLAFRIAATPACSASASAIRLVCLPVDSSKVPAAAGDFALRRPTIPFAIRPERMQDLSGHGAAVVLAALIRDAVIQPTRVLLLMPASLHARLEGATAGHRSLNALVASVMSLLHDHPAVKALGLALHDDQGALVGSAPGASLDAQRILPEVWGDGPGIGLDSQRPRSVS